MTDPTPADETSPPAEDTPAPPAKPTPVAAGTLISTDDGTYGVVVGADEDGYPMVAFFGGARSYQLAVKKVGK